MNELHCCVWVEFPTPGHDTVCPGCGTTFHVEPVTDEAKANTMAADRRRYRGAAPTMSHEDAAEWYELQASGLR